MNIEFGMMLAALLAMAMLASIMLSIVIPTLNAQDGLTSSLPVLAAGAIAGGAGQLVIADGGSNDATLLIAEEAGADVVHCEKGRGNQLAEGAKAARGDWLLFIHADTVLANGWQEATDRFMANAGGDNRAGVFRFRLDDKRFMAGFLEWIVAIRTRLLGLPYGDQCLLISRRFYDEIGGFKPIAIMEDVDIVRRIGRKRFHVLPHDAVTSASRYHKDGYLPRMARNMMCISLWFAGMAPDRIAGIYK